MFILLVKYKEREGHCLIPKRHQEYREALGKWLSRQRTGKRKATLTDEYQRRLEELGVVWGPSSHQWERMFTLLVKYKERKGHCRVPKRHQEDGEALGEWLSTSCKAKRKATLSDEYQRQLEELGVVWDPYSHQWERIFTLLVQYKEREGHFHVPFRHKEDGEALGMWLHRQRTTKKKPKMEPKRLCRLEDLGVVWKYNRNKE